MSKKHNQPRVYTPQRPAKWALKRVKSHLPIPKTCHLCSAAVVIRHHNEVYGKVYGAWPWVYACTACGAHVGMHPNTNLPLGTLADKNTRTARRIFKDRFNPVWENGRMDRTEAYRRLAKLMGISVSKCHIGYFSIAQCLAAEALLPQLQK